MENNITITISLFDQEQTFEINQIGDFFTHVFNSAKNNNQKIEVLAEEIQKLITDRKPFKAYNLFKRVSPWNHEDFEIGTLSHFQKSGFSKSGIFRSISNSVVYKNYIWEKINK
jgi:hypothetical protein